MFLCGKKGVSPLVATVLLILFSVLLGVAVMSWGEVYIEKNANFVSSATEERSGCDLIKFNIIKLKSEEQLCVRNNVIEGFIENGPDAEIYDLHARVLGTQDISIIESALPRPLPKAYAIKLAFGIKPIGIVKQVKFVPKIKIGNKIIYCTDNAQMYEDIRFCK